MATESMKGHHAPAAPVIAHEINPVVLAIMSTVNGVVLFFIAALSGPYTEPAFRKSLPFGRLIAAWTPK